MKQVTVVNKNPHLYNRYGDRRVDLKIHYICLYMVEKRENSYANKCNVNHAGDKENSQEIGKS